MSACGREQSRSDGSGEDGAADGDSEQAGGQAAVRDGAVGILRVDAGLHGRCTR